MVHELAAERARGICRAVGPRMLRAADAAQELTRAPILGEEPEHRDEREQRDHELAGFGVLPRQPDPIGTPKDPDLGAVQRSNEADSECLPELPIEVAVESDQYGRRH